MKIEMKELEKRKITATGNRIVSLKYYLVVSVI